MPKCVFLTYLILLSAEAYSHPPKVDKSRINVAWGQKPRHIDARFELTLSDKYLAELVHCSLYFRGPQDEHVNQLASNSAIIGKTKILVELKTAKFSDGSPVTANDVAATYNSILNQSSSASKNFSMIQKVEVLASQKLAFTTKKKFIGNYKNLLTLPIYPRGTMRKNSKISINTNSCGPFTIGQISHDQINLNVNRHYIIGEKPKNKIALRMFKSKKLLIDSLRAGNVDIAQNQLNPSEVRQIEKKNPSLNIHHAPSNTLSYLGINFETEILASNQIIRKAIDQSIDRNNIIKHVMNGFGLSYTHINESISKDLKQSWIRDTKMILAATRKKAPEKLRLKLITVATPEKINLAKSIVSHFLDLGLEVEIHPLPERQFREHLLFGKFDFWLSEQSDDPNKHLSNLLSSKAPPFGENYGRYNNKELDTLIEALPKYTTPKKREHILMKIRSLLNRDIPTISLWKKENIVISSNRISGFKIFKSGGFRSLSLLKSLKD